MAKTYQTPDEAVKAGTQCKFMLPFQLLPPIPMPPGIPPLPVIPEIPPIPKLFCPLD